MVIKWFPTSIRLSKEEKQHVKRMAKAQRHGKMATVIKRLIQRDMREAI